MMSIIFQTLKKSRNAPYESSQAGVFRQNNRLNVLRKRFIPVGMLLMVILAFGAMYGSSLLRDHVSRARTPQAAANGDGSFGPWRAEYMTPSESKPRKRFAAALAKASRQKGSSSSKAVDNGEPVPGQSPSHPDLSETLPKTVATQEEAPGLDEERIVEEPKIANASDNQLHRIKVQQCDEITSLVARLERLLSAGEFAESKEIIDRLGALKGHEDSYVLKLRSYWHIRQGEFAYAEPLLAMVLEKNQDDLEAGINMAIVEMHGDKARAARNRLIHLKNIYDADTVIPELLKQINLHR